MANPTLEQLIQSAISRNSADTAREIVRLVRQNIAAEIAGGSGGPIGAAPTAAGGRKPGRPRKEAAPPTPAPAAHAKAKPGRAKKAAPAAKAPEKAGKAKAPAKPLKAKSGGSKGRGGRTYSEADLARALEVIGAKPGLRPSEYKAQSGIDEKVWDNVIYKLKSDGKLKVVGKARNTSYLVA